MLFASVSIFLHTCRILQPGLAVGYTFCAVSGWVIMNAFWDPNIKYTGTGENPPTQGLYVLRTLFSAALGLL